jgi:transposase
MDKKEVEMNCLKCGCSGLVKNGFVGTTQRYKCKNCTYQMTRFTPRGYCEKDKSLAILLYVSGLSMNRIGYIIGVTAQSVMRWIRDYGGRLEGGRAPLSADKICTLEVDELCHFLKKKLTNCGFGRFMIVPLSDVSAGRWAIVPAPHSET